LFQPPLEPSPAAQLFHGWFDLWNMIPAVYSPPNNYVNVLRTVFPPDLQLAVQDWDYLVDMLAMQVDLVQLDTARVVVLLEHVARLVGFAASCLCAKPLCLFAEFLCEGAVTSLVCFLGLSRTFTRFSIELVHAFFKPRVLILNLFMGLVIEV
jgi:hypothetical protein